jgi:hypothetical protein
MGVSVRVPAAKRSRRHRSLRLASTAVPERPFRPLEAGSNDVQLLRRRHLSQAPERFIFYVTYRQ